MINRIDHTALVVKDLEGTIAFYTRVLGFHVARRLAFPVSKARLPMAITTPVPLACCVIPFP